MTIELELHCQDADDWAALDYAVGAAGLETVRPAMKHTLLDIVVLLGSVGTFGALVRALEAFLRSRINRSITIKHGDWVLVIRGRYSQAELENTLAPLRALIAPAPSAPQEA